MIPVSNFLTFLTSWACCPIGIFLCRMPRPPSCAIAIANDSEYGLSSGVITRDESRGLAIAAALETGMCHVNCSSVNDEPHVPFGGSKSSGVGRHGGRWSTETFTETRWVTLERGGRGFPPVF